MSVLCLGVRVSTRSGHECLAAQAQKRNWERKVELVRYSEGLSSWQLHSHHFLPFLLARLTHL